MKFLLEEVETEENFLLPRMDFSATTINNRQIKITWKDIPAKGIQNYIIQRAVSNSNAFFDIEALPSAKTSEQGYYEFTDQDIKRNILYNYRLRCLDPEGEKFSKIKTAMITGKNVVRNVTANAAEGQLRLLVDGYGGNAEFSLFNTAGENVFSEIQNIRDYSTILMNIGIHPKGIYLMQVKTRDGIITERIIIK